MSKKASFSGLLIVVLMSVGSLSFAKAQNSIIVVTPPNDFRFEDLWNINLSVLNPSEYQNYYINLKAFDPNKGLLIDVNSKQFSLATSSKIFSTTNQTEITPFNYLYRGTSTIQSIISRGGLFPAGDYRFNYTLYGVTDNGTSIQLSQQTINHSVIMPSVLQLVSVYDKDSLEEDNPNFIWLPASATRTVGSVESEQQYKLRYSISIAEVLTNQTPYVAITSNPQFFFKENIDNTILTYPFSARQFGDCKTYAWQVKGVINGQTVISSEIWTFKTKCEKEEPVPEAPVLVKQKADLTFCNVKNNYFSFSYYEEYDVSDEDILNIEIFDEKNVKVLEPKDINLNVKRGLNTYTLSVCPSGLNLTGKFYKLVITNSRNEKWYLRIFNKQEVNNCY